MTFERIIEVERWEKKFYFRETQCSLPTDLRSFPQLSFWKSKICGLICCDSFYSNLLYDLLPACVSHPMLFLFYSSKTVNHIMSPFCLKPSGLFPLELSPNSLFFAYSSIILSEPGLFSNLISYHSAPCSLYFSHTAFLSVPLKFHISSPCMVFEFAVFLA